MKILFLFALSVFTFLSSGCGHDPIIPRSDFITDIHNGETMHIQQGGLLHIDLPAQREEGRQWSVAGEASTILRLLSEPKHRAYTDALGSAGTTVFDYKAVAVGTETLSMVYKNASDSEPVRRFQLTIVVEEPHNPFKKD